MLCASYPALAEIWQPLQTALGQVGLALNAGKTQVWAPQSQRTSTLALAEKIGAEIAQGGLLLCGQPISEAADPADSLPCGDDDFVHQFLNDRLASLEKTIQDILRTSDLFTAENKCQLLRGLLPSKFMHILRSLPLQHTEPFWERCMEICKSAIVGLLELPPISMSKWEQMCLPLGMGGCNLHLHPAPSLCSTYSGAYTAEH